jgi:N-acetylmuramoyl-L-alanine amidase
VLLRRLSDRVDQHHTVSALREQEDLRGAPPTLAEWRVALGEPGGLDVVTASVRRGLAEQGASVVTLHHPDWSTQARRANRFGAGVYLGIALRECSSEVCYFATDGFESRPGHALADAIAAQAGTTVGPLAVRGMRLAVLRETAMPAVLCRLDPATWSGRYTGQLAHDLRDAMTSWVTTQRA